MQTAAQKQSTDAARSDLRNRLEQMEVGQGLTTNETLEYVHGIVKAAHKSTEKRYSRTPAAGGVFVRRKS